MEIDALSNMHAETEETLQLRHLKISRRFRRWSVQEFLHVAFF